MRHEAKRWVNRALRRSLGVQLTKAARGSFAELAGQIFAERGVPVVPLVSDYRAQCPPLCASGLDLGDDAATSALIDDSMRVYFEVEGTTIRDAGTHLYEDRMRMVLTAIEAVLGRERPDDLTFLDVAGSLGYCAIQADRLGFDALDLEGRASHEAQFDLLQRHFGTEARFQIGDAEALDTEALGAFDVVSAQGLLYHLYDHLAFLRAMRKLTRRLFIIETHVVRHPGLAALPGREDLGWSRDNPFTRLSLIPSLPLLLDLLDEAGFTDVHALPYPHATLGMPEAPALDIELPRVCLFAR